MTRNCIREQPGLSPSRLHGRSKLRSRANLVAASLSAVLVVGLLPQAALAQRNPGSGTGSGSATTTTQPSSGSQAEQAVSKSTESYELEQSAASLRSEREAVRAQVADLQSRRDQQFEVWALNQMALEAAQLEVAAARMRAERARIDALAARERLTSYAGRALMSPPASQALAVLSIGDATDASRAHELLAIAAAEQRAAVGNFLSAQRLELKQQEQARVKAAEAGEREALTAAELERLDELLVAQRRLDAQIDRRLDAVLAEVAALEKIDEKAARELEEQEKALAAQSKAAVGGSGTPRNEAKVAAQPASAPSGGGTTGGAGSPAPATTTTTTPEPTGPPPAPPSGIVTWQDVTKVGGIWVHKSIASRVQALLDAAASSGIRLSGGGFRDPSEQIRLRQAHCGPTEYDVYYKPASQCTPPTAQPGRSMHERGLAIDFQSGGKLITSRSDPAFQWLSANAAGYGLYNLPSEPWHWSTNGN